jgi:hypothetical protein
MVSEILYLTLLISEIKNIVTAANGLLSTIAMIENSPVVVAQFIGWVIDNQ